MILAFDTETTGIPKNYKAPATDLDNWPRLVQLGWVLMSDRETWVSQGNVIIRPDGWTIPPEAAKVHGITTERALEEGIPLAEAMTNFIEDMNRSTTLLAHNLAFDEKIVAAEMHRLKAFPTGGKRVRVCTMQSTTAFCAIAGPYGPKWPKLQELHKKLFGVEFDGAHDAFADIEATIRCYWKLMDDGVICV